MKNHTLVEDLKVPASQGKAFYMQEGDKVEIIDVHGKQVGDLMAWPSEIDGEWMSPAHTVTRNWSIHLKPGDHLATNMRRDIFAILEDTVGHHDIVVPCCDHETYVTRYGIVGHRSCLANLREALQELREERHTSGELAWNIFMKNRVTSDGKMIYEEPEHGPGSCIILEALMDVLCALSACPQDQTPTNGWNCSEMQVRIWRPTLNHEAP
jgi:uncharacterized protein YcgI (DUF1989 family)